MSRGVHPALWIIVGFIELIKVQGVRKRRDWTDVAPMVSPKVWIRRVVINLGRSRFRCMGLRLRSRLRFGVGLRRSEPDLAAEYHDFWEEVRGRPGWQEQAITLFCLQDLSIRDVADAMNVAPGTAKALLHQRRTGRHRQLVAKGLINDEVEELARESGRAVYSAARRLVQP